MKKAHKAGFIDAVLHDFPPIEFDNGNFPIVGGAFFGGCLVVEVHDFKRKGYALPNAFQFGQGVVA